MKSFFKIIIVILFLGICVFLILNKKEQKIIPENSTKNFTFIKIKNFPLKAEIANTEDARAKGLSGRESLSYSDGMLFVFDKEGNYPFWMPDMHFSIDIIWLDADKKIVFIKENATPESYPETFGGEQKSKYVLEVVSGFAKKNNLEIGDKVEF